VDLELLNHRILKIRFKTNLEPDKPLGRWHLTFYEDIFIHYSDCLRGGGFIRSRALCRDNPGKPAVRFLEQSARN
jgi:hypothetical protein